jgi:hypothetical protein
MHKIGIVSAITLGVLVAAWVSATGAIGLIALSLSQQFLNGMGAAISAILFALIIGIDGLLLVLMVRTPNRLWQP